MLGKLCRHIVLKLCDYVIIYVHDATSGTYELRAFDGEQTHSHEETVAPRGVVAASNIYDYFIIIN